MDIHERITLDPEVRSGKPCIRGTRITVYDILEYFAGGMSEAEILADFPRLSHEDICEANVLKQCTHLNTPPQITPPPHRH